MNTPATALPINDADRETLQGWVRRQTTAQQIALRAQIILYAAQGMPNAEIATRLGTTRPTVLHWRRRFLREGPDGLTRIQPGRGRKPQISPEKVAAIVEATLHSRPRAATHWSCRSMAQAQGVSPATVQRIWDAHGLQPHRVKTFKLSRDRQFIEKLTDVVGLYLNPPDKALVLCVDEKSQIQALDRTQPGPPMKKGRCGTMTHDYKRNGTTTLFAALKVLEGTVVGECYQRHRHQEFLKFLRRLDREFPKDKPLHLILDNYGTHKHPNVAAWLDKHPRFELHFIPTSSSWLNLVERWFRELSDKQIRRGVFHSVADLEEAIDAFLQANNENPKPFVWTASVESILEKVSKSKVILETYH
jgi:transposase